MPWLWRFDMWSFDFIVWPNVGGAVAGLLYRYYFDEKLVEKKMNEKEVTVEGGKIEYEAVASE